MTPPQQRGGQAADVSKSKKLWRREFQAAEQRLAGLGGTLEWSSHAYEVFRWCAPGLTLIFYPHRTTAMNHHIRVRKGTCEDQGLLRKAIHALAENSCTFQFPTEREFHREGVDIALKTNRGYA